MPARDGDHGAGRIDAWAIDDPLVDSALESEHRAAHVANGGEATHERVRSLRGRNEIEVADVTE
jgi:hypothetical protein